MPYIKEFLLYLLIPLYYYSLHEQIQNHKVLLSHWQQLIYFKVSYPDALFDLSANNLMTKLIIEQSFLLQILEAVYHLLIFRKVPLEQIQLLHIIHVVFQSHQARELYFHD